MDDQRNYIQQVSLSTILREKELWILVLLGILYFHRPLFLGETFFFRDLFSIFLTQKQLLTDFIRAGELPLWDPYLHGGRPYLANALNSVLYPSNLLYIFLPFFRAFNVNIVLHFICYPVFAYLFSRLIGLHPVSSLIAGLVYGFCGYTLSLINLLNMFLAMTHLPLLLVFWHLFLFRRKRMWLIMTVIVGVIQIFAGSPEINVISLLFLSGWTVFYPYPQLSIFRRITLWLILGVFIIGIASIQIFPLGEMVAQSSRGYGMSYAAFSKWSLDPRRLLELFFPEFSGHVDTMNWVQQYWGSKIFSEGVPLILSIYFGCISIVLSIIGGLHGGRNDILPLKVRIFLLSVIAFSLLLSVGRFLPFFHFLYQNIPLITLFRFPIKFLSAGIFPCALLVGYASEVHFRSLWAPSSKFLGIFWSISAILIVFTVMFLLSDNFAYHVQEGVFKQSGDVMRRGIGVSFIHTAAVWLLMTLLYQYRRLKRGQWQHWILACILLVDLLSAGKHVNHYAPEYFFTDVPDAVQLVRHEIGDGRLFRTRIPPLDFKLYILPNDVMWMYRWTLEVLDNSFATFFRLPIIFHIDFDRLAQVHIIHLKTLIESLPWEQRLPLLATGGVTLIITSEDISLPEMERIGEIPNWADTPFYLYRNNTAAARVEFVTNWKEVDSDADALGSMLNPSYNPRKYVILQKPESTLSILFSRRHIQNNLLPIPINMEHAHGALDTDSAPHECDSIQITTLKSTTHFSRFSVSNSCDGYLVFSEPFYPGWKVSIDGTPTPMLRANYAFSAIFLPTGNHEVERHYRPNSLLFGILGSVLFCLLLFLVTYKGRFFRV